MRPRAVARKYNRPLNHVEGRFAVNDTAQGTADMTSNFRHGHVGCNRITQVHPLHAGIHPGRSKKRTVGTTLALPVATMNENDTAADRPLFRSEYVGHCQGIRPIRHRAQAQTRFLAGVLASSLKLCQYPDSIRGSRIDVVVVKPVSQGGGIQCRPGRRVQGPLHCTVLTLGMVSDSTLASRPSTFSTRRM